MREKYIESVVTKYAKMNGLTCIKCGMSGVPDKLFLSKKGCFFIEFKTEKGKLSMLQEQFIKDNLDKIKIYVVYCINDGKKIIEQYIS